MLDKILSFFKKPEQDVGIYMVDQDAGVIAENKEILARLENLKFNGQQFRPSDDTIRMETWANRLRKEGRNR